MNEELYLYKPELKDYWYEQKLLSDPKTMSYNAGWNVSYDGYDFDTGCIDFPKSKWEQDYIKRQNDKDHFFRYLVRKKDNEFVGYLNFHLSSNNKYEIGILIENKYRGNNYSKEGLKLLVEEAFNNYNITELYDDFEEERSNSCKSFFDMGFKIANKKTYKKFNEDVAIVEISLRKDNYNMQNVSKS